MFLHRTLEFRRGPSARHGRPEFARSSTVCRRRWSTPRGSQAACDHRGEHSGVAVAINTSGWSGQHPASPSATAATTRPERRPRPHLRSEVDQSAPRRTGPTFARWAVGGSLLPFLRRQAADAMRPSRLAKAEVAATRLTAAGDRWSRRTLRAAACTAPTPT